MKSRLRVVTTITRNDARRYMRPVSDKIGGMKAIENNLAMIDKIEKFLRREIIFPIDVILEK